MADRSRRQIKKTAELELILTKEREREKVRQVRKILKKAVEERTEEEQKILDSQPGLVHHVQESFKKLSSIKDRRKEIIDSPDMLSEKCEHLAQAIKEAKNLVIYTGAGISTAAHIPDYRGPEGIWTLLQKGEQVKVNDLSLAEPTYTHMAIRQLHKAGLVSHVVSQNCDGLHLRSGHPRRALSEVHGNMFIEVCPKCKPLRQYFRLFDVTEHTGLHKHKTGRFCNHCKLELIDTIVHFGERGTLQWPLNWKGAAKAVSKADAILCLGTSLKVLKRYHCLWASDKPHHKRPKLYIVNLQWTPKDMQCSLKIHGKCDEVMKQVIDLLEIEIPEYKRSNDPLFQLAVPLLPDEESTTTRIPLVLPEGGGVKHRMATRSSKQLNAIGEEHSYAKINCFDHNTDNNSMQVELSTKELTTETKLELDNSCNAELSNIGQTDVNGVDSASQDSQNSSSESKLCDAVSSHDSDGQIIKGGRKLSGWYGKGFAKCRKPKRRKL